MLKKILAPLIVYVIFFGLYAGYSKFENNSYIYLPIWDVEHYLTISEQGYIKHSCRPGIDYPEGEICGNVGWYPMWPLVVRTLKPLFGGNAQYAFLGLVYLFGLAGFVLLFLFIEKYYSFTAALLAILALAGSPPGFYLLTGFPYALMLFLFAVYIHMLFHKEGLLRETVLFLAALMLALSYPSGMLFALIPVIWYWFEKKRNLTAIGWYLGLARYIIPFALGPLILWSYFYFKFDDFFLQLHFQEKYDRTWAFPLWVMGKSLINDSILSPENLTMLWYGLIFILFYPKGVRREFWIFALVLYFFSPATGAMTSVYRHYLVIFPIYLIPAVSERPLWLKAVFIALGLGLALFRFFPEFMHYQLM